MNHYTDSELAELAKQPLGEVEQRLLATLRVKHKLITELGGGESKAEHEPQRGEIWWGRYHGGEVRVMAVVEGWVLARRTGAGAFTCPVEDWNCRCTRIEK